MFCDIGFKDLRELEERNHEERLRVKRLEEENAKLKELLRRSELSGNDSIRK